MARRIIRRRRVAPGTVAARPAEDVRPGRNLPEAKQAPVTRVLIVAPGPIRTVLASRISGSEEVKLAGVADNESSAVEKVITEDADVAAIFMHLGGELAGLDIARNISRASPDCGVLIIVGELEGIDLRRHARMFGVNWSYVLQKNAESGHNFGEVVQCVARGVHWIDPVMKRVLEAVWKVAGQGRDMEFANAVKRLEEAERKAATGETSGPELAPPPVRRGIQTMQAGNSGVGSTGFGVNKAS